MGAHKYNPTAIAAKNGELPPKPPKKSKREIEREISDLIREKTGINEIYSRIGIDPVYGK